MKKYFAILVIVGFLLYLPSLFGPFVWDDEDFVYANQYVADFRIDKFFTDSVTAGRGKVSNYFRPVQLVAYSTIHALFGYNPFWFHLLNVLVHIGAAGAILIFLNKFLAEAGTNALEARKSPPGDLSGFKASLLIAILFLIHPVQTEAVSYISGLSDPLFVLFGFLAMIYQLKNSRWAYLFFALALLSKETGIVFLGLLFLVVSWKKLWPYVVMSGVYLWYHLTFINQLDMKVAWGNNLYANSVVVRLLTFIQSLSQYVTVMVFPRDLFMERDFGIKLHTNLINPYLAAFLLINALLIIFLYHRRDKILWFFFLGFYITFVPYSGLILINGIFYEHFLYLPLVFFFGFWIFLLQKFLNNKIVKILIILVLGVLIIRNVARQFDWNDAVRFYSQTLAHAPGSIRVRNGLAMAYADQGQTEKAISEYTKAITIDPTVPNLYHNLANTYVAEGNTVEAEKFYLKAIEVDPRFIFSWQALANLYQQTGQAQKLEDLKVRFQKIQGQL